MDTPVAVTDSYGSDLLHTFTDGRIEQRTFRLVANGRTVCSKHFDRAPFTHAPGVLQFEHEFPFYCWL